MKMANGQELALVACSWQKLQVCGLSSHYHKCSF